MSADDARRRTYPLDLRSIDTSLFLENPIVCTQHRFDDPSAFIGRASISNDKREVEVEYFDAVPDYDHTIGIATMVSTTGILTLLGLSVVSIRRANRQNKEGSDE